MDDPHRFTLVGRDGRPHVYEATLHPAQEGLAILAAFVQFGIGGATGRIDLAKLLPLAKLVRDILTHTTRDDLALAADGAFDAAYRANYGELAKAVVEVVDANDFLPLPDGIRAAVKAALTAKPRSTPSSPPPPAGPPPSE